MEDCIFCKIVKKELPAKVELEDEELIAFSDIHPSADIHILITPKQHISGLDQLTDEHAQLLLKIYRGINKLVQKYQLSDKAYRVVVNGGKAQQVPHLHFHLLGGKWRKFV